LAHRRYVCFRGRSGIVVLNLRLTDFDPYRHLDGLCSGCGTDGRLSGPVLRPG
jgi:hypothetical protein